MASSKNRRSQQALKGASLLTLAGIIAKILSAVYRVPFQNLVGDTGFYVYQQVYPIYGIGMTFALSGLPNYVGKQISWQVDLAHRRLFLRRYSLLVVIFSLLCFSLTFFLAPLLAQGMADPNLAVVIRSVSYMFLAMPFLLLIRGAFQGRNDMKHTAVSQVIEQVVRVGVILGVAYLYSQVFSQDWSLYEMGAWAMASAGIAGFTAASYLILALLQSRGTQRLFQESKRSRALAEDPPYHLTWPQILRTFVTDGLVICSFSALLVFFQLIDSFTLYDGLLDFGLDSELAKVYKGVYDRGQPFVQLGMVFSLAFQTSYLPLLSQAFVKKQKALFREAAARFSRLTFFISLLVTAGIMAILPELNVMLFSDAKGSGVLEQYLLMIVLASWVLIYHNIFLGQNQWFYSAMALGLGLLVKGVFAHLLVSRFGLVGGVWSSLLALVMMLVLMNHFIPHSIKTESQMGILLRDTSLVVLLMWLAIMVLRWTFWLNFPKSRAFATLFVGLAVLLGAGVVLLVVRRYPILNPAEWQELPLAKYWIKNKES